MIKTAIVGCGYWGKKLIRNMEQVASVDMLYDKELPGTSFRSILENKEIEAVVIALPATLHYEFTKKALEAGKHVLVEKPMTTNSKQAQELIDIAKREGKILMVDSTFLYHSAILKIKEIIDSGEIGKVNYFDSQRINWGTLRPDVNVAWDLAPHDISILNFLFKYKPISTHLTKQEELAHLIIEYQEEFIAHIYVSWLSPIKIRQIMIGGSKKTIVFDDIEPINKVKIYDNNTQEVEIPMLDFKEPLLRMCETFISSIKNNKKPLTDGQSGLEVIKILEL